MHGLLHLLILNRRLLLVPLLSRLHNGRAALRNNTISHHKRLLSLLLNLLCLGLNYEAFLIELLHFIVQLFIVLLHLLQVFRCFHSVLAELDTTLTNCRDLQVCFENAMVRRALLCWLALTLLGRPLRTYRPLSSVPVRIVVITHTLLLLQHQGRLVRFVSVLDIAVTLQALTAVIPHNTTYLPVDITFAFRFGVLEHRTPLLRLLLFSSMTLSLFLKVTHIESGCHVIAITALNISSFKIKMVVAARCWEIIL